MPCFCVILSLSRINEQFFLHEETSHLHRAILAILEMSLTFNDMFIAFTGTTGTRGETVTEMTTPKQTFKRRHHRSRRQRRQRKNIIGFSFTEDGEDPRQDQAESSSSSEDEDEYPERVLEGASFSFATSVDASVMLVEGGFPAQIDAMSKELERLVRYIRKKTEALAGGRSDAASAFGILAFALEDWDL
jgi:gamma-tubulin complex component 5